MDRRQFLATAALAAATASRATAGARLPIRKGVIISMLPEQMPLEDRLKLAVDAGFDDLECHTVYDVKQAEAIKRAAEKAKLRIGSVMNSAHWESPLNSPDPAVVQKGLDGMKTSLENAHLWGAEAVLLVPAVVSQKFSYFQDAWTRSQREIRKLLPLAEKYKVTIAIEEVWNKFLVSPTEFARYVDEFKSPYVKAYLDVGNMVFYGYPQDWIRVMGPRIAKVHLKDFRYRDGKTEWVNLGEGDIAWKEVYKAFSDVGYKGTATVELEGGDAAYLKDLNHRVESILRGEKG